MENYINSKAVYCFNEGLDKYKIKTLRFRSQWNTFFNSRFCKKKANSYWSYFWIYSVVIWKKRICFFMRHIDKLDYIKEWI